MTIVDPDHLEAQHREARRAVWSTRINKADAWFAVLGLGWVTPLMKAAAGDNPDGNLVQAPRLAVDAGSARLNQYSRPRAAGSTTVSRQAPQIPWQ